MVHRLGGMTRAFGLMFALGFGGNASAQATPAAPDAQAPARCEGTALWDARVGSCVEDPRLKCAAGDLPQCVAVADHYRDRSAVDHDQRLAMTYYRRACDGLELRACHALGLMALRGEGGPRDTLAALRWFHRGCRGGHAPSCTRIGELRSVRAPDQAHVQWSEACQRGDARACVWRTEHETQGAERCNALHLACQQNQALACALLASNVAAAECTADPAQLASRVAWACEQDEPEACYRHALLASDAPTVPTLRARLTWACETEHREACVLLSRWLAKGTHGPVSAPLSEQYAERACDLGDMTSCMEASEAWIARSHSTELAPKIDNALTRACSAQTPNACRRLGDVLLAGEVIARDRDRAQRSYEKGCEQEDAIACLQLGDIHGYRAAQADDEGVRKLDWVRASDAMERACDLRNAQGCIRFGLLALNGINGSGAQAHVAMLTACSAGAPEGCLYAGRQLALGDGVGADTPRALALLQQACSAGSTLACQDSANGQLDDKLRETHAYPMPYAIGAEIPALHRSSVPAVAAHAPIRTPPSTAPAAPRGNQTRAERALDLTAELGFNGQNNGQAARMVVDVTTPITDAIQIEMRVPMVVADAFLDVPGTDPSSPDTTSASTFRLGNVTVGGSHTGLREDAEMTLQGALVLPLALAPGPGDNVDAIDSLERQLAVRAYQLANAVDGMRAAWLYRPNATGLAASLTLRRPGGPWVLEGSLRLAGLLPVRGEKNAELIAQVDVTVGRQVGPATFAVRSSVSGLSEAEVYAPALTALVAVEDRSDHVWSLRAVWLPVTTDWDVPSWGVSAGFSHVLP